MKPSKFIRIVALVVVGAAIMLMTSTMDARTQWVLICKPTPIIGLGRALTTENEARTAGLRRAFLNWDARVRRRFGSKWLWPCLPIERDCSWPYYKTGIITCSYSARPGRLPFGWRGD